MASPRCMAIAWCSVNCGVMHGARMAHGFNASALRVLLKQRFDLSHAVFFFQWQAACCISRMPLKEDCLAIPRPLSYGQTGDSNLSSRRPNNALRLQEQEYTLSQRIEREICKVRAKWNVALARSRESRSLVQVPYTVSESWVESRLSKWNEALRVTPPGG